ncbi:MAG TPA: hypothetical protein VHK67_03985 [Rhabdochlamydiaceae bacterium]|jgi:hypothetical protein|nr:hypothetical protein [Rhabdochlamydiaceae bacterium]
MKLLFLLICPIGFLIAEEPLPEDVKIDPVISIKEQLTKRRKKGWDFSEEQKKSEGQIRTDGITFNWKPQEVTYSADHRAKSFRNDASTVERMEATIHYHEQQQNLHKKN